MSGRDALLKKINRKQELEAELKEQMEILRTVSRKFEIIYLWDFD